MGAEEQKTILLVDDEAIIAMSEKTALEKYGYNVITALSGEEAVTAVETTPGIDLILMDINLGKGIDGTEAAALILRERDIPVVFLSSHMEPEVVEKTEKITSYGYVVKDSSITVLDASIKMAFKLFEAKISEMKKEEALRESEERYRALFDSSPDAILLTAPNGRILAVNAATFRMFEMTKEEILSKGRNGVVDTDDPRLAAALAERDRTGRFSGEITFIRRGGVKFPGEVSSVIFKDKNGNARTSIIIRELSERMRMEESLRRANRSLRALRGCDYLLVRAVDEATLMNGICRLLVEQGGYRMTWIGFAEQDEAKSVRPVAQAGFEAGYLDTVNITWADKERGRGPTGTAIRSGRSVLARNIPGDPAYGPWRQAAIQRGYASSIALPLQDGSRCFGTFNLYAAKPDAFDPEEIKLLAELADNLAFGIGALRQRAVLTREESKMREALAETQRFSEALRENEERFRTLYENSTIGIYRTTPDGGILLANPALVEMLGFSSIEDLATRDLEKNGFEPSYPRSQFIERIEKDGMVKGLESAWKRKDGASIYIRESARVFRDAQGKALYYDGTAEDITERKLAEAKMAAALKAIRESEERQQLILATLPIAIFTSPVGPETDVSWISGDVEKVTGFTTQEYMAEKDFWRNRLHPEDRDRVLDAYKSQSAGDEITLEYRWLCKSGDYRWFYDRAIKKYSDHEIQFVGLILDISERKRSEEEIQRQLSEKEILLKEVHHRIKNNIASISGLISLHMQSVTNPQAVAVLKDAIGRVDSMRLLYDKLLLTEDYEDLSVKNYLDDLIDTIIAIFPDKAKIKVDKRIDDFHLDAKRLFPLGIIINELLTNKMKYAFIDRKTGSIKIDLSRNDNHVNLVIEDNGKELPAGFDINKAKGFGLMLVKMLSQQLAGSFSIEKHKGTRCTIEFDI